MDTARSSARCAREKRAPRRSLSCSPVEGELGWGHPAPISDPRSGHVPICLTRRPGAWWGSIVEPEACGLGPASRPQFSIPGLRKPSPPRQHSEWCHALSWKETSAPARRLERSSLPHVAQRVSRAGSSLDAEGFSVRGSACSAIRSRMAAATFCSSEVSRTVRRCLSKEPRGAPFEEEGPGLGKTSSSFRRRFKCEASRRSMR